MKINIRHIILAPLLLSACQSIPYADRAKAYEQGIKDKFVGHLVDDVVLAYGPPDKTYPLSDGREMLQFVTKSVTPTTVNMGGSYYSYGNHGGYGIGFPFSIYSPFDAYPEAQEICAKRFIINKDKIVETFSFEGKGCF